jgi:signal transduction histidine kinase
MNGESMPGSPRAGPPGPHRDASSGFLARLSIAYKVPLITGALLLLLAAALSVASYYEVRSTAINAAADRLRVISGQMAAMANTSGRQSALQLRGLVDSAQVRAFLASPDSRSEVSALEALQELQNASPTAFRTELRSSGGTLLLGTGEAALQGWADSGAVSLLRQTSEDSIVFGALRWYEGSVVYPFGARFQLPKRGAVVQWRRLPAAARGSGVAQLQQFIGSGARLLVGNRDGSNWSVLIGSGPPDRPAAVLDSVVRYGATDSLESAMAITNAIPSRPWLMRVELPLASILKPADQFLRQIALIAVGVVLIGLAVQWFLGRRITHPLRVLTDAADQVAAGDYSREVPTDRADEIGRLAKAFEAMAGRIRDSQQRLEEKVAERTRDLDQANRQLRDAQEALLRREKLTLLGQLASGVGHELRNPLGVMSNAIEYLELVLEQPSEDVREYLGVMRRQVALSERIIGDLLDVARIKTPDRVVVTLVELVDAQLERIGSLNGVRVQRDFPDDLPAVWADPVQLGQVVFNLLTNALQAVDGLRATLTLRGRATGPDRVRLEVRDTGPGIPEENLEKIFEPLFTTKSHGIGLGLAVSRSLVQANDGELTAESGPGEGATFRIVLPAATASRRGLSSSLQAVGDLQPSRDRPGRDDDRDQQDAHGEAHRVPGNGRERDGLEHDQRERRAQPGRDGAVLLQHDPVPVEPNSLHGAR